MFRPGAVGRKVRIRPMNALAACSSPYLRQHAENPVAWVPWSSEAFAEARRREVPVLVSIGYATCHWCHVMAHESFEDPATAALMNNAFVCIKVDREEHPEVDAIYMDAVQALTGHGGWPLNAFCDHQGRPFHAMTYAPRAGWQRLVEHLGRLWRDDRPRILNAAAEIARHLEDPVAEPGNLPSDLLERLADQVARAWDDEHPGLGWNPAKAPKFPPSQLLNLAVTGDQPDLAAHAVLILEAMQDGGIHDRVGGGFHRYSVDRAWRIPHFEKMLYDNAQLIAAYAVAGARWGRADFTRTAINAGDYLLRDLAIAGPGDLTAGLASAEDADDPDGEGSFYAWSPEALAVALGPVIGPRLAAEWDLAPGEPEIGPNGHADPVTSHIPHPRGVGLGADPQARRASWESYLPLLRALRAGRPRPIRDDKVLTDQNGLALEALATLARLTGEERFITATRTLAAFVQTRHTPEGLLRLPHRPAVLTDYAAAAHGLIAAFNALGDPTLVDAAERIISEATERLAAPDGGYFIAPAGREDLIRRGREAHDNAWPSGQNHLALAAVRLHHLTGEARWAAVAEGIFAATAATASQAPSACATLLTAWRDARRGARIAVVVGSDLLAAARRSLDGQTLVVPNTIDRPWPCLTGRRELTDSQVLVCHGTTCRLPARTPAMVATALSPDGV